MMSNAEEWAGKTQVIKGNREFLVIFPSTLLVEMEGMKK